MIIRVLFCVLVVAASIAPLSAQSPVDVLSKTPLAFEPNSGQAPPEVRFLSRGNGHALYLTDSGAVLSLNRDGAAVVGMTLPGRNPSAEISASGLQPGVTHYLFGNRQDWHDSIPHYSRVQYSDIYPGIDVIYYGNNRQLEYDFEISPRVDPSVIRMDFSGADSISLSPEGDLVLGTSAGEIRQHRPVAYQKFHGIHRPVEAEFVVTGNRVHFKLGAYDPDAPLTIDPVLVWGSYIGGSGDDAGTDVAVDAAGNVYVTGYTTSPPDFPLANPLQPDPGGRLDAFVMKLNPSGTLVFSTYIGGSGDDESHSIGLDAAANVYITGYTRSTNFPIVNGFQTSFGGVQDAYVLKLNNAGNNIDYSTYLGGNQSDRSYGLAVDPGGDVVVAGMTSSTNFPVMNAFRGSFGGGLGDGFLTRISAGGALVWSTFLGGIGNDQVYDVVRDTEGSLIVTGFTTSSNFPTANALFSRPLGGEDAFITKFNAAGNGVVFSTYFGGSNQDNGVRLTTDADNHIYITGYTSSVDFPLKNPPQLFSGGVIDAFLVKLNPDGQDATVSTYIGSEDTEGGVSLAVGQDGFIYVAGFTNSVGFYAINSLSGFLHGLRDGFLMKLTADAGEVVFSTFVGGFGIDGVSAIALDPAGNVYVTGFTNSIDLPITPNTQGSAGGQDGFLLRINADDIKVSTPFQFANLGGMTVATAGQTNVPFFGYATAELASGPIPSGLEIVDLRSAGLLVNEVAIPLTPPTVSGRFYARTSTSDNTALSIMNPTDAEITVDFYFAGEDGEPFNFSSFTLPALGHLSALLTDAPFSIPAENSGSLTFTTSVPVYAAALRVDTTAASPVNNYIPIVQPNKDTPDFAPTVIPHFADGLGWYTQFYLVNPTESPLEGELRLVRSGPAPGDPGRPAELVTEQGIASVFPYSIPPRGVQKVFSRGESSEIVTGHADIVPSPGFNVPAGFAILGFTENNGVLKTTVGAEVPATEFKMYVEVSGVFGEPLAAMASIALANTGASAATVRLELFSTAGTFSGLAANVTLPPGGHLSRFLTEIPGFENIPSPFQGMLRVTTSQPGVTMAGFRCRYNEQHQFLATATGPLKPLTGNLAVFPHMVDGGGYATQFVLINGTTSAGASGTLKFFNQLGQPLHIAIVE